MRPGFQRPGYGRGGDRGDDLAGAAPREPQRSDLQAGQFVKRASFARSVKEPKPAFPRARERAAVVVTAGNTGQAVLREGWQPVRVETLGL